MGMLSKEKMIESIEKRYGYIYIDGDYYEGTTKDGKPVFKKQPRKKVEERIKMAKDIAVAIQDSLDPVAVLTESIMRFEEKKDIDHLHNIVFNSKKKFKAKTRTHHCVDMKVGNFIIPVVD